MKTQQRNIDFSGTDFLRPDSVRSKAMLLLNDKVSDPIDFRVQVANADHVFWIEEICDATLASAKESGTGISGRTPEFLGTKMIKGEAVIAFTSDGRWAGFCFISSWDNDRYVSNSGFIVALEFIHTDLSKRIKRKIFELGRQKYPQAIIFSLTTGSALMKMNHELGFEPVTYSDLTADSNFWEDCKSCVNCPILMYKERKNCLCTAMLYNPKEKESN